MINSVFILGAGASKEAGAPLMADFLDQAKDLWASSRVTNANASFQDVFKAIGRLQPVHSKSEFDIYNVESVFAAMEMGKTLEKFPGCDTVEEIDNLIANMKVVIVKTIENTLLFPLESDRAGGIQYKKVSEPPPYREFIKLIQYLRDEARPSQKISVITFNYDLATDLALIRERLGPDYCLSGAGSDVDIPLLKLHGSLNWIYCPDCGGVSAWNLGDYLTTHKPSSRTAKVAPIEIGSHLNEYKSCSHGFKREPVIVPPTWNKADYHRTLSKVWSRAAKELGEAENIFVVGYSLPNSDAFFRYLYALGSVSEHLLKRLWVFDPDKTGGVQKRYRELLGPGARDRFRYFSETFALAITTIRREFSTQR